MIRPAPYLPYSGILLMPVIDDVITNAPQERPHFYVYLTHIVRQPQGRQHDLAVYIKLSLFCRAVSDTDGLRPLVTVQVEELFFMQILFAAQAVHDLYLVGAVSGKQSFYPPQITLCLGQMPKLKERQQDNRSVAHPRKPIIPVSYPADLFRQRGGRRRGNGACRFVVQQL